eukprot:3332049-Amphidinium_carterae.1
MVAMCTAAGDVLPSANADAEVSAKQGMSFISSASEEHIDADTKLEGVCMQYEDCLTASQQAYLVVRTTF